MKALVLGLGISGKSACSLLKRRGIKVEVCDDLLCPRQFETLRGFDLLVPSPGIPSSHPLYALALREGIAVVGEVELFLGSCRNRCIGVTGTNGKTTTVSMIAHALGEQGIAAVMGGNIGIPLCEIEEGPLCILELSSFQLETMHSPKLEVGVILNITADHLDRYLDFSAYSQAKLNLARCVRKGGALLIHDSVPTVGIGREFETFSGGSVEATRGVCRALGLEGEISIAGFKRPAHRLEVVGKVDGVTYINDSKATNIAATCHALGQVQGQKVLILGGRDKGLPLEGLAEMIGPETSVIAYGEAREKIANALQPKASARLVKTLREAVEAAKNLAPDGATVLFSPACSSFDAFCDYVHRGEAFRQYVLRSAP